jgi:hypothetical protein
VDVYFLAGADDFILHVAAGETEDLRSFVVETSTPTPMSPARRRR